jgi:hypothetical protein
MQTKTQERSLSNQTILSTTTPLRLPTHSSPSPSVLAPSLACLSTSPSTSTSRVCIVWTRIFLNSTSSSFAPCLASPASQLPPLRCLVRPLPPVTDVLPLHSVVIVAGRRSALSRAESGRFYCCGFSSSVVDTRRERATWLPIVAVGLWLLAFVWEQKADSSSFCSLLVTQCSTTTQKSISALQHMRQIHPGSPLSAIRMDRLTTEVMRVAHEP